MKKSRQSFTQWKQAVFAVGIVGLLGGIFWYFSTVRDLQSELTRYKERETELKQALYEERLTLLKKRKHLERLLKDKAFLEWLARKELGYAKPDEIVYQFKNRHERN